MASSARNGVRKFYNEAYFKLPQLIPLDKIVVDKTYQRELKVARVNKMVREFNPDINQPIAVVKNADGTYSPVDGQHRDGMMEQLGAEHILAFVFEAKTVQEQAGMFGAINTAQKAPTLTDRFKARVTAGDPVATSVGKILSRNGLSLTGTKGKGFQSSSVAESMYRAGTLDATLKLLNVIWPVEMRTVNLDAGLIGAFGLFRGQLSADHAQRLVDVLSMRTPDDVAKATLMMGLPHRGAVASSSFFKALIHLHNEGGGRYSGVGRLNRNNRLFIDGPDNYKQKLWEAEIYG